MLTLPAATLSLLGYVNQAAMRSPTLGLTFGIETLLYHIKPLIREITTEGVQAWTVTYVFSYNPTGWNKYVRAGEVDPATMYDAAGDEFKQYPPGDFNLIVL